MSRRVKKKKEPFPGELNLLAFGPKRFRFPVEGEGSVRIEDEVQHALFQRCCETFRVLDLFGREIPALVERYSKYHDREPFAVALKSRFFDLDERIASRLPPEALTPLLVIGNVLQDLRVTLCHTEALPFTLQGELEETLVLLRKLWDELRGFLRERYNWNFREIHAP